MRKRRSLEFGVLLLSAAVLSGTATAGCNRSDSRPRPVVENNPSVDNQAIAAQRQPMTVTGCVQKDDHLINHYILTEDIKPSPAPVTSRGPTAVNREETREATHSYELLGSDHDFEKLVGHEVRVTGTLDHASTLGAGNQASNTSGDRDIKASDLSGIAVQQLEQVAPQCDPSGK